MRISIISLSLLTMLTLQAIETPGYICNALIGTSSLWTASQVSRLLTRAMHTREDELQPINSLEEIYAISDCAMRKSDFDIEELNALTRDVTDLHSDVRFMTPDNKPQAYEDIRNENTERIWILRDDRTLMTCFSQNKITVNEDFFKLSYPEKRAILRHELCHAIRNHYNHIKRASTFTGLAGTACINAGIWYLSRGSDSWYTTTFATLGHIFSTYMLGIACGIAGFSAARQWSAIESDLAAADTDENLKSAIERLRAIRREKGLINAASSFTLDDAALVKSEFFVGNQDDAYRFAYIQHYAHHETLPWNMMLWSAYWMGRPLHYIARSLELFDGPTDYLIQTAQNAYEAVSPASQEDN